MIAILLGTGFEEMEALVPYDMLHRGGLDVKLVSVEKTGQVVGGQGVSVQAHMTLEDLNVEELDCVILPGGLGGVASLERCDQVPMVLRQVCEKGGLLCAICAAPRILHDLGYLQGRHVTAYPTVGETFQNCFYHGDCPVVVDGALVTGRAAGSSATFGKAILEILANGEVAEKVASQMYVELQPILWQKEASYLG